MDPGADAAGLRLEVARAAPAVSRSSSRTATTTISAGSRTSPRERERPSTWPPPSRTSSSVLRGLPGRRRASVEPRGQARRRRDPSARRARVRDGERAGALAGAPRVRERRGDLLRRRALRRLRSAAPTFPARTGTSSSARSGRSSSGSRPRRSYPRTRAADDARRQARHESVSRRPPRRAARPVSRFEAPRGTQDVTPAEWPAWQRVLDVGADLFARYGYRRIQTPVFEDTELFARTAGVGSDVVQKEMYTFSDRAERSLTLRPEGTAPICRAYLEHGMHGSRSRSSSMPSPRCTATRLRSGAGTASTGSSRWRRSAPGPAVDAELIQLYAGSARARRRGVPAAAELDRRPRCRPRTSSGSRPGSTSTPTSSTTRRAKRATSPLRVFDVKNERTRALLADAPTIGESLYDACREHFASVRQYLDAYGVRYELDPTLVRGSTTTRERRSSSSPRRSASRSAAAGATTTSSRSSAGRRRRGSGPGRNRAPRPHPSGSRHRSGAARAGPLLPRRSRRRPRCRSCRDDAARAAGLACDTDYAGRSPKGQRTQLARSGRAASSTCAPTA